MIRVATLPLRNAVVAGESLDSWLEHLARRHGMSAGCLAAAAGLNTTRAARTQAFVDQRDMQFIRRFERLSATPESGLLHTLGVLPELVPRLALRFPR